MPKVTKATLQFRVEQVAELLLAGKGPKDIFRYGSERDAATGRPWRVSTRQIENYIERAKPLVAHHFDKTRDESFALAIAQRNDIYAHAYEDKDWRTCLVILKDRDELLGLYPSSLSQLNAEVERLTSVIEGRKHVQRKTNQEEGPPGSNGATVDARTRTCPDPG
jgi:hypothetical protein